MAFETVVASGFRDDPIVLDDDDDDEVNDAVNNAYDAASPRPPAASPRRLDASAGFSGAAADSAVKCEQAFGSQGVERTSERNRLPANDFASERDRSAADCHLDDRASSEDDPPFVARRVESSGIRAPGEAPSSEFFSTPAPDAAAIPQDSREEPDGRAAGSDDGRPDGPPDGSGNAGGEQEGEGVARGKRKRRRESESVTRSGARVERRRKKRRRKSCAGMTRWLKAWRWGSGGRGRGGGGSGGRSVTIRTELGGRQRRRRRARSCAGGPKKDGAGPGAGSDIHGVLRLSMRMSREALGPPEAAEGGLGTIGALGLGAAERVGVSRKSGSASAMASCALVEDESESGDEGEEERRVRRANDTWHKVTWAWYHDNFGTRGVQNGAPVTVTVQEDFHFDFCCKCFQGGDLMCCEAPACPHVYHRPCAEPPISRDPQGPWYCPTCLTFLRECIRPSPDGPFSSNRRISRTLEDEDWGTEGGSGGGGKEGERAVADTGASSAPAAAASASAAASPRAAAAGAVGSTAAEGRRALGQAIVESVWLDRERGEDGARGEGSTVGECDLAWQHDDEMRKQVAAAQGRASRAGSDGVVERQIESSSSLPDAGGCAVLAARDATAGPSGRDGEKGEEHAGAARGRGGEYLVKWLRRPHAYNSWVDEEWLRSRFPGHVAAYERLKAEGELPAFRPEWTEPERLLGRFKVEGLVPDRAGSRGRGRGRLRRVAEEHQWLVKWRGMGYDQLTWEPCHMPFLSTPRGMALQAVHEREREGSEQRATAKAGQEARERRATPFCLTRNSSDKQHQSSPSEEQSQEPGQGQGGTGQPIGSFRLTWLQVAALDWLRALWQCDGGSLEGALNAVWESVGDSRSGRICETRGVGSSGGAAGRRTEEEGGNEWVEEERGGEERGVENERGRCALLCMDHGMGSSTVLMAFCRSLISQFKAVRPILVLTPSPRRAARWCSRFHSLCTALAARPVTVEAAAGSMQAAGVGAAGLVGEGGGVHVLKYVGGSQVELNAMWEREMLPADSVSQSAAGTASAAASGSTSAGAGAGAGTASASADGAGSPGEGTAGAGGPCGAGSSGAGSSESSIMIQPQVVVTTAATFVQEAGRLSQVHWEAVLVETPPPGVHSDDDTWQSVMGWFQPESLPAEVAACHPLPCASVVSAPPPLTLRARLLVCAAARGTEQQSLQQREQQSIQQSLQQRHRNAARVWERLSVAAGAVVAVSAALEEAEAEALVGDGDCDDDDDDAEVTAATAATAAGEIPAAERVAAARKAAVAAAAATAAVEGAAAVWAGGVAEGGMSRSAWSATSSAAVRGGSGGRDGDSGRGDGGGRQWHVLDLGLDMERVADCREAAWEALGRGSEWAVKRTWAVRGRAVREIWWPATLTAHQLSLYRSTIHELKRAASLRAQAGSAAAPAAITAIRRKLLQCCQHLHVLPPAPCPRQHATPNPSATATSAGVAAPAPATPPAPATAPALAATAAAAARAGRSIALGEKCCGKLQLLHALLACLQREGKTALLLAHSAQLREVLASMLSQQWGVSENESGSESAFLRLRSSDPPAVCKQKLAQVVRGTRGERGEEPQEEEEGDDDEVVVEEQVWDELEVGEDDESREGSGRRDGGGGVLRGLQQDAVDEGFEEESVWRQQQEREEDGKEKDEEAGAKQGGEQGAGAPRQRLFVVLAPTTLVSFAMSLDSIDVAIVVDDSANPSLTTERLLTSLLFHRGTRPSPNLPSRQQVGSLPPLTILRLYCPGTEEQRLLEGLGRARSMRWKMEWRRVWRTALGVGGCRAAAGMEMQMMMHMQMQVQVCRS
ncbi:hypothetical protein CLOP_g8499 [Closterium sp. NIES-67]|nr:hypothetical protein CLOP_g8499 [Closterium sp. NIES-67]